MLTTAAILLVILAIAHSYLGEKYTLIRLFKRELPHLFGSDVFTKQVLRFAWHLTSVAWLGFALILLEDPSPMTVKIIGVTFAIHGIFPVYFTKGKHLSWIFFFAVAILCLFSTEHF